MGTMVKPAYLVREAKRIREKNKREKMEKTFKGIISNDGKLKIYDTAGFSAHIGEQKGKHVLISIITEDPASSIFSINYFKLVVCKVFQEIFKREYGEFADIDTVVSRLQSWCPAGRKENGDIIPLEKYSQEELNYLIKHSKFLAAKEFDVNIKE